MNRSVSAIAVPAAAAILMTGIAPAASAQGVATITNATMTADLNHNFNGLPGDTANDSDGITPGPFPQSLAVSASLNLPIAGNGSFYDADVSGTSNIRNDGVDGVSFFEFDYARPTGGTANAGVRTTVIFTVTGGFIGYELDAQFFDTTPGNIVRLTNETTGDFIDGTSTGSLLNETGVLAPGTYRFTAHLFRGTSGSGSPGLVELERAVQYDLTFTQVPAPASALAMLGLATTARRRRA